MGEVDVERVDRAQQGWCLGAQFTDPELNGTYISICFEDSAVCGSAQLRPPEEHEIGQLEGSLPASGGKLH